jgi:hypothetical protein
MSVNNNRTADEAAIRELIENWAKVRIPGQGGHDSEVIPVSIPK